MNERDEDVLRQLYWHLVDRARAAAMEHALSYRRFHVGCAVLAWRPLAHLVPVVHAGYHVYTGANVKLERAGVNTCAERFALLAAAHDRCERVVAIVVAGEMQPDDESGRFSPTLHPCGECRRTIPHLPGVSPETRIITAHLEGDTIFEDHSLTELLTLYAPVTS